MKIKKKKISTVDYKFAVCKYDYVTGSFYPVKKFYFYSDAEDWMLKKAPDGIIFNLF